MAYYRVKFYIYCPSKCLELLAKRHDVTASRRHGAEDFFIVCVAVKLRALMISHLLGNTVGLIFFLARQRPLGQCLHDHTRHTTLGRTPLDKWSARRRDLYLTTHNTQQTDIHAPDGVRTLNLSKRATADPFLRARGHWDWHRRPR